MDNITGVEEQMRVGLPKAEEEKMMRIDTCVSSLRELSDPHGSLRIDDSHDSMRIGV